MTKIKNKLIDLRTGEPLSDVIQFNIEEPPSLYEIFEGDPMAVIEDDGSENPVICYHLSSRLVFIQSQDYKLIERHNLLSLKEKAEKLYHQWWAYRNMYDHRDQSLSPNKIDHVPAIILPFRTN